MGSYCLTSNEFQFNNMKKVMELDGGDGCTLRRHLMTMNYTLKNG